MRKLSQLAETLQGSEIVKLGNEIKARVARGEQIHNFTIGDFSPAIFPIPTQLKDYILKSFEEKHTNYPPADGLLSLREGVSGFAQKFEGLSYAPNEILIGSGGRPMIYSIFRTVVDAGDKVIYAVPSWNNNHYVHINGAQHCVIEAKAENAFMPTAQEIKVHIKGATLICLCSPQNPTGTTFTEEGLKEICDLIIEENKSRGDQEKKLYLMFDQMYGVLTFGQTKHHTPISVCPEMKDFTIFVDGISKVFSATGLRVGWSMGPADVIAKMKALLTHIGAWAPMAEQWAVAKYLENLADVSDFIENFKKALHYRLEKIYEGFQTLKSKGYPVDAIEPQAGIYLTVKLDLLGLSGGEYNLQTGQQVADFLLNEAHLAIVPFSAFGAKDDEGWYRISVGTCSEDDIPQMLAQLEGALAIISKEKVNY